MKFLQDSKFFWTEYHGGKINIIMHLVSFSFLFCGLTVKSVTLVLIGLSLFDEIRDAYNYFFVHNSDPKFGLRIVVYGRIAQALPMVLKSRDQVSSKCLCGPGTTIRISVGDYSVSGSDNERCSDANTKKENSVTMDIRQGNTDLSSGAGRGIAKRMARANSATRSP